MEGFFTICSVLFTIIILARESIAVKPKTALSGARIVGGIEIPIENVPYQVSIAHKGRHVCGGSLIKENRVLSAAHCFPFYFMISPHKKKLKVYAGIDSNIYSDLDQHAGVKQIIKHKLYSFKSSKADIALLQLTESFNLSSSIGLIPLNTRIPQKDEICLVTGWGATEARSVFLMGVNVSIIENQECARLYGRPGKIQSDKICAGDKDGDKDSCQGDSGGPLVCNQELVGIVSWGEGCGRAETPGVYTAVAAYIEWINETEFTRKESSTDNNGARNSCYSVRKNPLLTRISILVTALVKILSSLEYQFLLQRS